MKRLVVAAVIIAAGSAAAWWWQRAQAAARGAATLPVSAAPAGPESELQAALASARVRAGEPLRASAALVDLGRLYHANNFNAEAAACWEIMRQAEPRTARWCYYLADLGRARSDEEALRRGLEQTLQLYPTYAPAWLQLGDLEFKTAHPAAAEAAYNRRLALVPGDPYASLGLARLALQRGEREAGLSQVVELVRRTPGFPSAHNLYAEILAAAGDEAGATEQRRLGSSAGRFRAAADPWLEELRAACYDIERLIEWGEIDLQTQQGDRGAAQFERARQLAPDNPRVYERLGAYHLGTGNPAAAAAILEQGSRLRGAPDRLFGNWCDAAYALRQPELEVRAAETGLRLWPESSMLHNGRAHGLVGMRRWDEAIAEYRLAMQYAPFAADPATNLGDVLLQRGRITEARAALAQALELQPRYTRALVLFATLELDAGELDAAERHVRVLAESESMAPGTRNLATALYLAKARAAAQQRNFPAAEQACRDGLALAPEAAVLHGLLGAICVQTGRLTDARQALDTAHRLQPEDPRVTLALGELYARLGRGDDARRLLREGGEQAKQLGEEALVRRAEELRALVDR